MDHPRGTSGSGEDNVGIPEDMRCKRSDGKQWRCSAMSMPDKTVCEKHYIQAKKRAANSALRASLKKSKRITLEEGDELLEGKNDDLDTPLLEYRGLVSGKKNKEKLSKSELLCSPESPPPRSISARNSVRLNDDLDSPRDMAQLDENWRSNMTSPASGMDSSRNRSGRSTDDDDMAEASDRSTSSSEETGWQTCHQCQRSVRGAIVWCLKCDRRGYCNSCISTQYSDIPLEEIQRLCPACRGTCNCKVCLRVDNLIKVRIREIPVQGKLQYLHCLLSSVLPVVKHVHSDQCSEVELEKKLCGTVTDLGRLKLNADEQMCCNFCRIPIIDYHRHCANCSYDLCLSCCQDLREVSLLGIKEESVVTTRPEPAKSSTLKQYLSEKFPDWKANDDGSIPCPPKKYGGCGCLSLTLRRIFKMNWVAKLAKNVEEMVSGCKVYDDCIPQNNVFSTSKIGQFAQRVESDDNFLYCPTSQDIRNEGIIDFRKQWIKGEPVIISQLYDTSLISSWDPMVIWRGIQETADEKMKDKIRTVKAIDCLACSEVDIELEQFVKGYSEGRIHENGWPQLLKLKDWPSPSASEEFLMYQRPELISKLPLLEYIHSKWGLLNVAAKLPHYSLQNDVGPKILISYGTYEELGRGDSVINLHLSMRDMVYVLVHTAEARVNSLQRTDSKKVQKVFMESEAKDSHGDLQTSFNDRSPDFSLNKHSIPSEYGKIYDKDKEGKIEGQRIEDAGTFEAKVVDFEHNRESEHVSEKTHPGALLDVFRRKDVIKLSEYLRVHWDELGKPNGVRNGSLSHLLYDGSVYLNKHHRIKLKEEFGVEPWSFEQHLGQAVFIPAGCPFQMRNLQSTVQMSLDFLSPESLGEAVKLAEEIRCLPNEHEAKLQVVEVGKMSLYAASSAIKDVQKLVLDPRLGGELGFEDPNLTAAVSENLEGRMVNQRKVACA